MRPKAVALKNERVHHQMNGCSDWLRWRTLFDINRNQMFIEFLLLPIKADAYFTSSVFLKNWFFQFQRLKELGILEKFRKLA